MDPMGKEQHEQLSTPVVVSICFRIILDWYIGIKSYICFDMKFADFYQMERMANFPTKGSLDSLGLVSGSRLFPVLSTSSFYRHILSYLSRFGEILLKCSKHLKQTYVPMKF